MINPMTTHGALSWSELHGAEAGPSASFYSKLLGWRTKTHDLPGGRYTEFKVGDRSFGGIAAAEGGYPQWFNYFTVDDVDTACETARRLGGRITAGPFEGAPGRMARIADPSGAEFFVIAYRPAG